MAMRRRQARLAGAALLCGAVLMGGAGLTGGAGPAADAVLRAQGSAAAPSLLPPGEPGTPLHVQGRIVGPSGPVAGAALYVYQTDQRGYYSGEVDDDNTKPRLKARFTTGSDGSFAFRTIMPGQYPRSGPPAHIHIEVTPPGQTMEQFEVVFEGDSRLNDRIRADAKAGRFFRLCTPETGPGGARSCTGLTFRVG
jgi:protocatechuate 3,4-dioxygenase beta subunit